MTFDPTTLRKDFPTLQREVHGRNGWSTSTRRRRRRRPSRCWTPWTATTASRGPTCTAGVYGLAEEATDLYEGGPRGGRRVLRRAARGRGVHQELHRGHQPGGLLVGAPPARTRRRAADHAYGAPRQLRALPARPAGRRVRPAHHPADRRRSAGPRRRTRTAGRRQGEVPRRRACQQRARDDQRRRRAGADGPGGQPGLRRDGRRLAGRAAHAGQLPRPRRRLLRRDRRTRCVARPASGRCWPSPSGSRRCRRSYGWRDDPRRHPRRVHRPTRCRTSSRRARPRSPRPRAWRGLPLPVRRRDGRRPRPREGADRPTARRTPRSSMA